MASKLDTGVRSAEVRVALVIGVGDYLAAGRLANPVGDARAFAGVLQRLGFVTALAIDQTRDQLATTLAQFVQANRGADVALLYFAGHAVQIGGRNVLLPKDAHGRSAATLEAHGLVLDDVFAALAEVAPHRIILLDACRHDPFGTHAIAEGAAADEPSLRLGPGLGRIGRVDGAIYAFATAPGAVAEDGDDDHSPFTAALIKHLGTAGLEFGSVMKLVQMDVYERTFGRQLPYVEDALPALFFADTGGGPLPERDVLLLAMARMSPDLRAQVERIALARDVPLGPLYGALLANPQIDTSDYQMRERHLVVAANEFAQTRAALQALASSDPDVSRLRLQAEHDLSLGAFGKARDALTEAIALDHDSVEELEARLKERKLSQGATLAVRAGVSRARLDYREAAADFAAASARVSSVDPQVAWSYRLCQADNLHDHGNEFGDGASLRASIDTYRATLALAPRAERPHDWAATQNNLGVSLLTLGSRETGTEPLEQAVAAFRDALSVRTRNRSPLDWAATQNNLGRALWRLGEREGRADRLEQAVTAYRDALEERSRNSAPRDWATTQSNLGNALFTLGVRASGSGLLEQAVVAYRMALEERKREHAPLEWAATQDSLANALQTLGLRETGTERLEQAVAAYRESLAENRRERVPLDWSKVQNNLGSALLALGERQGDAERVDEAVVAYREALEERTRERFPVGWAMTQNNLGAALHSVGERTGDPAKLEQAVTAYRAAMMERTRDKAPLDWAMTQFNLAGALTTLGERDNSTDRFEQAIVAYQASLEERTRDRVPLDWAMSLGGAAVVCALLAERRGDVTMAREAAGHIEIALQTALDGKDAPSAAHFKEQHRRVRKIVERLEDS